MLLPIKVIEPIEEPYCLFCLCVYLLVLAFTIRSTTVSIVGATCGSLIEFFVMPLLHLT